MSGQILFFFYMSILCCKVYTDIVKWNRKLIVGDRFYLRILFGYTLEANFWTMPEISKNTLIQKVALCIENNSCFTVESNWFLWSWMVFDVLPENILKKCCPSVCPSFSPFIVYSVIAQLLFVLKRIWWNFTLVFITIRLMICYVQQSCV